MGFLSNITAKAAVWLAVFLIPAEAMPMVGCGCGGNPGGSSRPATTAHSPSGIGAGCPHCQAKAKSHPACCKARGAARAAHGCCGTKAACCCSKGTATKDQPCLCSANRSAPTPAPVSSDSPSDSGKSLTAPVAGATVVIVALPGVHSRAEESAALSVQTILERLSALCRLVI